jgi:hypothetical protein
MEKLQEIFSYVLKNTNCSYCQEYEKVENNEGWNLYIKEYEMYTALLLYHPQSKEDICSICKPNDIISLLDKKGEVVVKLEMIVQNKDNLFSTLVPTDEYSSFYGELDAMDKKKDKTVNAYWIGEYTVQIQSA